jgi:hypothetical protein
MSNARGSLYNSTLPQIIKVNDVSNLSQYSGKGYDWWNCVKPRIIVVNADQALNVD